MKRHRVRRSHDLLELARKLAHVPKMGEPWPSDRHAQVDGLIDIAADLVKANTLPVRRRYCGPCDKWVPASETECKACGADTELEPRP